MFMVHASLSLGGHLRVELEESNYIFISRQKEKFSYQFKTRYKHDSFVTTVNYARKMRIKSTPEVSKWLLKMPETKLSSVRTQCYKTFYGRNF
jgi:hypothetical protein